MNDHNQVYNIYFDTVHQYVVMEWKGYATSTQFREGTEAMLRTLIEYKSGKVLADAKDMVLISQDDQKWIENTFLPTAISNGFKAIALVKPTSYFNQVAIESVSYKVAKEKVLIHIFETKAEASEWLDKLSI